MRCAPCAIAGLETTLHALWDCPTLRTVWAGAIDWYRLVSGASMSFLPILTEEGLSCCVWWFGGRGSSGIVLCMDSYCCCVSC
ncbi:hypothetical protein ACOSQ2_002770 [Xanthoceras sorbifolium]